MWLNSSNNRRDSTNQSSPLSLVHKGRNTSLYNDTTTHTYVICVCICTYMYMHMHM